MPPLTPSAWAQIRADYEHTERPVEEICAEHGISSGTLRDRMRRWNWTRRRQPIPLDGPPPLPGPPLHAIPRHAAAQPVNPEGTALAADSPVEEATTQLPTAPYLAPAQLATFPEPAPAEATPALIAQRLQGAVARVLPAIEATLARLAAASTHPREMERAARALPALTRTLRELNALLAQQPVPEDDEPESLDAFRAELARKIDAIIAERPKPGHEGV